MQDENNKKEQIVTQLTLYVNKILTIEQQPTINYDEAFILCNEAYLYILQNNELNSYFNELKNKGLKFIESKKYNKFVATVIANNKHFFPQISEEYINTQFKTNPVLIENLTTILKAVGIETVSEDYSYNNLLMFIQDSKNYFFLDVEKFGMIFYTLLDILKSFSYGYLNLQPKEFNEITPETVGSWDDLTNKMIDIVNNETISNKIFLWNTQYKNRLLANLSKYQKEDTIKLFVYILEYLRNHFAGVKFTKEYFIKTYGLENEDFEIREDLPPVIPSQFKEFSHYIKTPNVCDAYKTSVNFSNTEELALKMAINTLVQLYDEAIRNGEEPNEDWLVPNKCFE